MEEKIPKVPLSDAEFLILREQVRLRQPEAIIKVIEVFDEDIKQLSKYMRMSYEEARHTLIVELLTIFQTE
ncbi:hypothetical protein [Saccharibacillus qingshengii]|uniref:hypothetical protein n=1 Tax=Saccharibacillus qingshengii TaxID=1763540 RepID=UPI00155199F4|nr:hypothetical protein [Saccharibacillus qingshengii]